MNDHFRINGSPTVDGYYTTYAPDEVTIDSSEDEGGGGSSDFSTAEVTINVNLPEGETVGRIEASMGFGSLDQPMIYTGSTVADANKISIVMYKGSGYIESIHVRTSESTHTFKSNFTTASGDVVWDSNVGFYGGWKVTGDGSLTTTFPYPDDDD